MAAGTGEWDADGGGAGEQSGGEGDGATPRRSGKESFDGFAARMDEQFKVGLIRAGAGFSGLLRAC